MNNINISEIERKPLLTVEEAAALVNKDPRTIKDWMRGYYFRDKKYYYFPNQRKLVWDKFYGKVRLISRVDLLDFQLAVLDRRQRNRDIIKEEGKRPKFRRLTSV